MRHWKQLGEVLVTTSITNMISHSHSATHNLILGITQPLIMKILSNPTFHTSHNLRFFEWSHSHHNPSPTTVYSLILHSLSHEGLFSDIPSLLLCSFIISSNFNLALQLLNYLQHLHLDPTSIYNFLLVALHE